MEVLHRSTLGGLLTRCPRHPLAEADQLHRVASPERGVGQQLHRADEAARLRGSGCALSVAGQRAQSSHQPVSESRNPCNGGPIQNMHLLRQLPRVVADNRKVVQRMQKPCARRHLGCAAREGAAAHQKTSVRLATPRSSASPSPPGALPGAHLGTRQRRAARRPGLQPRCYGRPARAPAPRSDAPPRHSRRRRASARHRPGQPAGSPRPPVPDHTYRGRRVGAWGTRAQSTVPKRGQSHRAPALLPSRTLSHGATRRRVRTAAAPQAACARRLAAHLRRLLLLLARCHPAASQSQPPCLPCPPAVHRPPGKSEQAHV